jgi:glycerophosphoryl diester phosphodiesterase
MAEFSENFYIIGHRGAAGERFENSLEGFEHALTLEIDMIEIDIREHSSELWVIHDHDLERLTGNAGYFEDRPDPSKIRLRNGEPVPTLRQVLDLTWGKLPLNIEIKAVDNLDLLLLAPISSGIPLQLEAELEQIAPYSWHFDNEYLDFDLVRSLRAKGIPSLVFTVNDIDRARELRQAGVAGIFTDYPSKMLQID